MKKLFSFLFILMIGCCATRVAAQQITGLMVPQYLAANGASGMTDRSLLYHYVARLSGLKPATEYRFNNAASNSTDPMSGFDNIRYIARNAEGVWTLYNAEEELLGGRFTTDANGEYTGVFTLLPAASGQLYVARGTIYMHINLNDGAGGSAIATSLAIDQPVMIRAFTTATTGATPIWGISPGAIPGNLVLLYDNEAGTGRPITATFAENDGREQANYISTNVTPASFYLNTIDKVTHAWATFLPNTLATGIRSIVQVKPDDLSVVGSNTSANGSWPKDGGGTVNTVNNRGGLNNMMAIDGSQVPLGSATTLPQTITFGNNSGKTYGDAAFTPNVSASSGLTLKFTSSDANVAVVNADNTISITGGGSFTLTATQEGNADYQPATATQVITIAKAKLTAKAVDQARVIGDPDPVFEITYSGFVNGDNAQVLDVVPTGTTTATATSPVGNYPITPAGGQDNSYEFIYQEGVFAISAAKQEQIITFNEIPVKTYGNAVFNTNATVSSGLTVIYTSSNTNVATVATNGDVTIKGAGTTSITASSPGTPAYLPAADVVRTLTVNKATLNIKADDQTIVVNHAVPALTITYTGFVYGETAAAFTTPVVISTTALDNSPVGNYPISVSGATSPNYDITFTAGNLVIEPLRPQTITFTTVPFSNYGDADVTFEATASSGLPVTVSSSDNTIAAVDGNLLRLKTTGTVTLTAVQSGDDTYAPATNVTQTLTIRKGILTVTAIDTTRKETEANPAFRFTYSGFAKNEDASVLKAVPVITTTATRNSIPGIYNIELTGGAADNYYIVLVPGKLYVTPAAGDTVLTVNAFQSAKGSLTVNYFSAVDEPVTIQLFDVSGARHLFRSVTAHKGRNTWTFDVAGLTPGIYPLRINNTKTKIFIR